MVKKEIDEFGYWWRLATFSPITSQKGFHWKQPTEGNGVCMVFFLHVETVLIPCKMH